jgi:hypothetical protein
MTTQKKSDYLRLAISNLLKELEAREDTAFDKHQQQALVAIGNDIISVKKWLGEFLPKNTKMKCKNCGRIVIYDLEGDLIHKYYENKGVDERWCEPKNLDSMKIAEAKKMNKLCPICGAETKVENAVTDDFIPKSYFRVGCSNEKCVMRTGCYKYSNTLEKATKYWDSLVKTLVVK